MTTEPEPGVGDRTALFDQHRRYLFAVAYRMLGIAEDAEDIVQDAWLKFAATETAEIEYPRTYLVTIVSRLCIDHLRSARQRREQYVGIWLPEPVPSEETVAEDRLEQTESASFAFLLLLERLSPLQRVVLVLYDVFDYSHDEVAAAIGSTVAASRQALRRARRRLEGASPPAVAPPETAREIVRQFIQAAASGNLEDLMATLAPDVVLLSDGGGRVVAAGRALVGADEVGRFVATVSGRAPVGVRIVDRELNGRPGILVFDGDQMIDALMFDVTDAGIASIYISRNPEKLRRLSARGADLS